MAYYIQRIVGTDKRTLETVDEFKTWKEARKVVAEYNMADPSARHYISSRCCRDWKSGRAA